MFQTYQISHFTEITSLNIQRGNEASILGPLLAYASINEIFHSLILICFITTIIVNVFKRHNVYMCLVYVTILIELNKYCIHTQETEETMLRENISVIWIKVG